MDGAFESETAHGESDGTAIKMSELLFDHLEENSITNQGDNQYVASRNVQC
jgi:hypothetical protein